MTEIKVPKKLIEVALPLDDINAAARHEKSVRQGHPSSLHLYWARRPLAAARAVLFAQLVNDPGGKRGWGPGRPKSVVEKEREQLFQILRELSKWENIDNRELLKAANEEIIRSFKETKELNPEHPSLFDQLPAVQDPFAGGGAIPLEAQRLGLQSISSDLNPLALLINKAMLEMPAGFNGVEPIGPPRSEGAQSDLDFKKDDLSGFTEDLFRYGELIKKRAYDRIGEYYPEVASGEAGSKRRKVISWIWARTVESPNPAANGAHVPLVKSFILSKKKGKSAWIEYSINDDMSYEFHTKVGSEIPSDVRATVGRKGATCILTDTPISLAYIREQGKQKKLRYRLMAVALEGEKGRIYVPPSPEMAKIASSVTPSDYPTTDIDHWAGCTNCVVYGYEKFHELYTDRQLLALETFSNEITRVHQEVVSAASKQMSQEKSERYAEMICIYLAFALDKMADLGNAFCRWEPIAQCPRQLFGKQAIPMVWDFAEANPFSNSSGSWLTTVKGIAKGVPRLPASVLRSITRGEVYQFDAQEEEAIADNVVISTDPPYYDNVPYSNLSDFFYLWLRKTLKGILPDFLQTINVPKMPELVANQFRHGGREEAERFFLDGMTTVMSNMATQSHPAYPVTIYYAFKASETRGANTSSSGWETFIAAVIEAGFRITGTWPLNTENASRMRGQGANALASSIVLVCRKRDDTAGQISRRDFQRELKNNLPVALEAMTGGSEGASPIAPVDLAQSAIGPGMAIYSKYESILNQDGTKMSVHDALVLINRSITEYLNPEGGNFDSDTLFCDDWFSQYGWSDGNFGEADTLARAKGTTVEGVRDAGVILSGKGKVRLLKWGEYPIDWDPKTDNRMPVWEACHHMIRELDQNGENGAGALLARMPDRGESIRQLAYHLYTVCERKSWAEDARAYNELIGSWHAIVAASYEVGHREEQIGLEL